MQISQRNFIEITALFFCSLFLFTWGLSSQEIIGFDSRFYLFAQEMWRYGVNWFPTTYQQPYADYPGTSTFLIYLVAHLFAGVNKFVAVFPSALAAALTLTLTYHIAALHNKRWGICAVFFLLLTITFLKSARSIALDMYPTLFTTACFYLLYSSDIKQTSARTRWIYLFLFLGFAFRGPIGLVIPTGVVCTYYLLDGKFKRAFLTGFLALLMLVICGSVLLALAYHVGGQAFLQQVLRMEVLGRIDNSYLPRYFYFLDSMGDYALCFPLAWLVIFGVVYSFLRTRKLTTDRHFLLQLIGWLMVILIGMSIPGDKKIRYVLPMLPAAALIAAYPLANLQKEKYFIFLRWIELRFFTFLPLLLSVLIAGVYLYASKHALNFAIHYTFIWIFLLILQAANLWLAYRHKEHDVWILMIATISFVGVYLAVMERVELTLDRARDFVQRVETERAQASARLVFYKEKPDGLPIKYLINMPPALAEVEKPGFTDDQQSLVTTKQATFFIASAVYFAELPKEIAAKFRIVGQGKLGHVAVVVFARK